jgi:hypothetical protein
MAAIVAAVFTKRLWAVLVRALVTRTHATWDVVANIMDFAPDHSIGLNYSRTGAGWMLSPQFRPNEKLFEVRYQWGPDWFPLTEVRFRWREELEQQIGFENKQDVFDLYLRVTWEFTIKDRHTSWFD